MTMPGQRCPVCHVPDPDHDWNVHEGRVATWPGRLVHQPGRLTVTTSMLQRSSSRGGARVRWLAVHSTEGIMRAQDLRDWASWPGSSHASADQYGALLTPDDGFVPYDRAAWTLRNGNPVSENIELCALASWTRERWLAAPRLLDRCAYWLAERSLANDVPLRRLTVAQVRAGEAGVIDHDDYTDATGDGTHWDVGEQFPWPEVMARAQTYRQTMEGGDTFMAGLSEAEQAELLALTRDLHYGLRRPVVNGVTASAALRDVQNRVRRLDDQHPDAEPVTFSGLRMPADAVPAGVLEPERQQLVPWTAESVQQLADTLRAELTEDQLQDLLEQLA